MAFMAKDKIVRTGDDLNLATLVNLQADATALGLLADDQVALSALADTAITTAQTGVAMTTENRLVKVAKVAMTDDDAAGGVFAFENPEAGDIIVTSVVLNITTQSTVASTIDVGVAADATTSDDSIFDGQSAAAAGLFGTTTPVVVEAGEFVTASEASGDVSGLAGNAYIHYILI